MVQRFNGYTICECLDDLDINIRESTNSQSIEEPGRHLMQILAP